MQIASSDDVDAYVVAWMNAEEGIHAWWVTPAANARRFAATAEDHRNIARSYAASGFPLLAGLHEGIADLLLYHSQLAKARAEKAAET